MYYHILNINRNKIPIKKYVWLSLALSILLFALLPSIEVSASIIYGLVSGKLIVSGAVSNSQLLIGTVFPTNSLLTLIVGATENVAVLSPFTGAGSIVNTYTLIFVAVSIVILVGYLFKDTSEDGEGGFHKIIIGAIIIFLVLSLLAGLQPIITNLFGGISGG